MARLTYCVGESIRQVGHKMARVIEAASGLCLRLLERSRSVSFPQTLVTLPPRCVVVLLPGGLEVGDAAFGSDQILERLPGVLFLIVILPLDFVLEGSLGPSLRIDCLDFPLSLVDCLERCLGSLL